MKDLVIFGNGKIAEVVYYYASEECGYNVVAFTADKKFIKEKSFKGQPLISFEELSNNYPPQSHDVFVAIGYHDLNQLRTIKLEEVKAAGYNVVSIVSPLANLPKSVKVGENCFIMPPSIIHPEVEIGDNTFVWSGSMIGHHSKIGANCWLTSTTKISGTVKVGNNCFFAVNSTVAHDVEIGNNCFIGANALIIRNLPDDKVVIEPASKVFRLNSEEFLRFSNFNPI